MNPCTAISNDSWSTMWKKFWKRLPSRGSVLQCSRKAFSSHRTFTWFWVKPSPNIMDFKLWNAFCFGFPPRNIDNLQTKQNISNVAEQRRHRSVYLEERHSEVTFLSRVGNRACDTDDLVEWPLTRYSKNTSTRTIFLQLQRNTPRQTRCLHAACSGLGASNARARYEITWKASKFDFGGVTLFPLGRKFDATGSHGQKPQSSRKDKLRMCIKVVLEYCVQLRVHYLRGENHCFPSFWFLEIM